MEGYLASVFIGIALGLIGGGGSILTVPVLVYLFHIDAVSATAYSLFIVGSTSVVGSFSYFKKGLVHVKTAAVFGIPSIIAVFLTRAFIVPAIPQQIFVIENFIITKNILLMLLFAVLMIFASYSMIKKCKGEDCAPSETASKSIAQIILQGLFVGAITGLIGAGGGFLIIPALVNLLRLEIKQAIGTSLLIIAVNSLIGFIISAIHLSINWTFLLKIGVVAIIGVLIGSYISQRVDSKKLKPVFGWFILIMGFYIIMKETII